MVKSKVAFYETYCMCDNVYFTTPDSSWHSISTYCWWSRILARCARNMEAGLNNNRTATLCWTRGSKEYSKKMFFFGGGGTAKYLFGIQLNISLIKQYIYCFVKNTWKYSKTSFWENGKIFSKVYSKIFFRIHLNIFKITESSKIFHWCLVKLFNNGFNVFVTLQIYKCIIIISLCLTVNTQLGLTIQFIFQHSLIIYGRFTLIWFTNVSIIF